MNIKVLNAGVHTSIQDLGRQGQRHIGVSCSGAMDEYAFLWANRLLSNPNNSAAIEITLGGATFEASTDCSIAITGADMHAKINQQTIENWATHRLKAGDRLTFDNASSGLRTYLAVAGGFITPAWMGSRSTTTREMLGGVNGTALKAGDQLPLATQPSPSCFTPQSTPLHFQPLYTDQLSVNFIPGAQWKILSKQQQNRFLYFDYQISSQCDRMGYRLSGKKITGLNSAITSEGLSPGTIQLPSNGQPIVLMKECQTIGGYPKLGNVTRKDLSRLSQLRPSDCVRFQPISVENAQAQLVLFHRFFKNE